MQEILPFVFDDKQIRVIRDEDGQPLFVGKDICEALGYLDTANAIKLHCKGVAKYHPLQTSGGKQSIRVLVEGDMYRLMTHSKLENAERFETLVFDEILPTIRKTGKYDAAPVSIADKDKFDMSLKLVQVAMAELNLAPSGRLLLLKTVEGNFGLPPALPNYAADNNGTSTEGSMLAKSLTELLQESGEGLSVRKANKILMEMGFLKEQSRPSTSTDSGLKYFKMVDGEGLKYGKNMISHNNPREPQPLWYADTFAELLSLITAHKETK